jgi:hypothetical protein
VPTPVNAFVMLFPKCVFNQILTGIFHHQVLEELRKILHVVLRIAWVSGAWKIAGRLEMAYESVEAVTLS